MKSIVFYDAATLAPYSEGSLDVAANGIGGAEATLARVAIKLSQEHRVTVAQARRTVAEGSTRLRWIPLAGSHDELSRADAIVISRNPRHMLTARRSNRDAQVVLWYHDWYRPMRSFSSPRLRVQSQLESEALIVLHRLARVNAVGVSRAHATNLREHFTEARVLRQMAPSIRVDYVYNPIPDALQKTPVSYEPTKLVFLSAAWKGLDMVLSAFQAVRESMPDMRLYVASPGYADGDNVPAGPMSENVTYLGRLSHAEVMDHLRTALCVFYPANRVPETFGCVFAESHAVGTPVLAHPFGAASELLGSEELIDAEDLAGVVERVVAWRNGARPAVSSNGQVRLSTVAETWERLLFAQGPQGLPEKPWGAARRRRLIPARARNGRA